MTLFTSIIINHKLLFNLSPLRRVRRGRFDGREGIRAANLPTLDEQQIRVDEHLEVAVPVLLDGHPPLVQDLALLLRLGVHLHPAPLSRERHAYVGGARRPSDDRGSLTGRQGEGGRSGRPHSYAEAALVGILRRDHRRLRRFFDRLIGHLIGG